LLIVKQNSVHQDIALLIQKHQVRRTYRAIVSGIIEEDSGTIDAAIGRSSENRLKNAVKKDGKNAVSHFKVLKRFHNMTYIEIELETGRTHQIRVHFAYIHHPVLGDALYGGIRKGYPLKGQMLHAFRLDFIHPVTKKEISVEAPIPDYFLQTLQQLENER
jgi:23S rRNA pseudouridine1911/1915/1917 synthase